LPFASLYLIATFFSCFFEVTPSALAHIVTHKSPMRYAFNTIAIFSENTDELGSH